MTLDRRASSAAAQHLRRAAALIELDGLAVLDIGCGSGDFLKLLLAEGADAHGLEVEAATVERAIQAGIEPSRVALGDGRTLPFPDASFDLVTFVYSFHHVPVQQHRELLAECARVLRPKGRILVFEPRPYGEMTEIVQPIEDETEVRTAAQALLSGPPHPFVGGFVGEYQVVRDYGDADTLVRGLVAVDANRAIRAADPAVRGEVERRFLTTGRTTAFGRQIAQPTAIFLLERQ